MRKLRIICFILILSMLFLVGCDGDDNDKVYTPYHVYSSMIESVEKVGMLTGVNAETNTQTAWDIGGTDLGFPYWDETRGQMYFLFGDTNHGVNKGGENWRSNVLGVTTDLDASDGIQFDSFVSSDDNGWATEIIESQKDGNDAEGERTTIPTGGIAINGTHYVFYMSVRTWHTIGWEVNFCSVAKSTDGKSFTVLNDLFWADSEELGQINTQLLLEQSAEETARHTAKNFLQIFPYQSGEYVYLFGIPNARMGGCKLGRVKTANIENFDSYEYYVGKDASGNAVWVGGAEGLKQLENNDNSYVVEPQVGELSVSYNAYLGKYVMSFYSLDRIVMATSSNLIDWSNFEVIVSSADVPILYGGFTNEKYVEQDGKVMYFMVSQYYGAAFGDDGYNVQIVRVVFK